MVTGNVEVTLDLSRVQVHGQHPVHTGFHQQVGGELGGDRFTPSGLAVSTGVAVIGHHRCDLARRSPAAGIHHDQQLHQVIIHRSTGGLDQKHIAAPDRLLDLHVELAVSEAFADARTIGNTQVGRDLPGQTGIGGAAEQAQPARVRCELFLFCARCGQKTGHGARGTKFAVIRW